MNDDHATNERPMVKLNMDSQQPPTIDVGIVRSLAAISLASMVVISSTWFLGPPQALAISGSTGDGLDYASETVQTVLQGLKENSGNADGTVRVLEEIAAIITEGKGVGGEINYQGIQLERGYVSDEDTTIYNPGLSLLTESEKTKIMEGIVESRKAGLSTDQWNIDTEAGFAFVRDRIDPLHMYELKGYLQIVPFYVAVLYGAVLAVQQFARDLFAPAYVVAALLFFAPIVVLVSIGPQ